MAILNLDVPPATTTTTTTTQVDLKPWMPTFLCNKSVWQGVVIDSLKFHPDHPWNSFTAVWVVACPQGSWPAAVFYRLRHPMPYAYGKKKVYLLLPLFHLWYMPSFWSSFSGRERRMKTAKGSRIRMKVTIRIKKSITIILLKGDYSLNLQGMFENHFIYFQQNRKFCFVTLTFPVISIH
jgi:hypothetical protein